jgi:hypothetical protein
MAKFGICANIWAQRSISKRKTSWNSGKLDDHFSTSRGRQSLITLSSCGPRGRKKVEKNVAKKNGSLLELG